MATVVNSYAVQGVDGYQVEIETTIMNGQPSLSIIGLGDQAVKEAGDRIQAAMDSCGYDFPQKRVIINLAPGDKKKSGSHFDLAMAIGLLQEHNLVGIKDLETYGLIGELSLNGRLRPCRGVLPMIIAAKRVGIKKIIIPKDNLKEASLVKDIQVIGLEGLKDVVDYLEGRVRSEGIALTGNFVESDNIDSDLDFADVRGQDEVVDAVVLAAAGGHNMLMLGEPGCGKTMIAQRIPTILPQMTDAEALEVTNEDKKVTISRVNSTNTYPSNFMFVAAMNPCPCGYYPGKRCKCTDYEIIKYRGKISGPILDRMDIQKMVSPVAYFEMDTKSKGRSSAELRTLVEKARNIQQERFKAEEGVECNAQMGNSLIQKYCQLDAPSIEMLKRNSEKYGYSARAIHKMLRLARTSADLDGAENIRLEDVKKVFCFLSIRPADSLQSSLFHRETE